MELYFTVDNRGYGWDYEIVRVQRTPEAIDKDAILAVKRTDQRAKRELL